MILFKLIASNIIAILNSFLFSIILGNDITDFLNSNLSQIIYTITFIYILFLKF